MSMLAFMLVMYVVANGSDLGCGILFAVLLPLLPRLWAVVMVGRSTEMDTAGAGARLDAAHIGATDAPGSPDR